MKQPCYFGLSRQLFHLQSSRLFSDFTAATLEKLLNASTFPKVGYPPNSLKDQVMTRLQAFVKRWNTEYRFAYRLFWNHGRNRRAGILPAQARCFFLITQKLEEPK
jgi:hypothetical protein